MRSLTLFGHRWVANGLLILAIGLIALSASISYRNLQKFKDAADYVNQTQSILLVTNGIQANLLQMESSARGYVLTRNAFYWDEVSQSKYIHKNYMDNLDMFSSGNNAQRIEFGIIRKAMAKHLVLMDSLMARHSNGRNVGKIDTLLLERSTDAIGKVRTHLSRFNKNEHDRLEQRNLIVKSSFTTANRTDIGALVVSIFCILMFYSAVRAQNNRLDHLNHDLENTNQWLNESRAQLEHQVQARTRELARANEQLARQFHLQTQDLERKRRELQDAAHFQRALLPMFDFPDDCWEIGAIMKPALEVGGDYYDYKYEAGTGTITLAIGDAAGHGLMASMIVSTVRSLFQTFGAAGNMREIFGQVSENLLSLRIRSAFMALALIRMRGFEIEIVSAGMPPFLLYRKAGHRVEVLPLKSIFLGSPYNPDYAQYSASLQEGDILLCFSDGVSESRNDKGEIFGLARLSELLLSLANEPTEEICKEVQAEERQWSGRSEPYDDISVMAIRMRGHRLLC